MPSARASSNIQNADIPIDQFFSGPAARADRWRTLLSVAERWLDGRDNRTTFEATLAGMMATESYYAYPGTRLLGSLQESASEGDAHAARALVQRINTALATKSFKRHSGEWETDDDLDASSSDIVPLSRSDGGRPYFETLIVTGVPAERWPELTAAWRRLRRNLDAFVYEPVFVGSFEDAFCATVLNPAIAAIVVHEGFGLKSRHDAPVLRAALAAADHGATPAASPLDLAAILKRVRPELDVYLV